MPTMVAIIDHPTLGIVGFDYDNRGTGDSHQAEAAYNMAKRLSPIARGSFTRVPGEKLWGLLQKNLASKLMGRNQDELYDMSIVVFVSDSAMRRVRTVGCLRLIKDYSMKELI